MVEKINNDEACPCGSGRNYSECHYNFLNHRGWRAVKTNQAIEVIKNKSKKMKEFYEKNVTNIENKIIYLIDESAELSDLPSYVIRSATDGNGFHCLIFNNGIFSDVKESIIAHEYTHNILRDEGYPTILSQEIQYEALSNMLNNLLQDPLIYGRLKKEFDTKEDFLFIVEDFKDWLNHRPNFPDEENEKLRWNIGFVRTLLIQKELYGNKDETEFLKYITERYPGNINDTHEILSIIDEIGNDSPEKQRLFLDRITERYNLQGAFRY